jgi:uncharacterized protein (DUF4415 family)/uncharacterized DUF497 family protein
MDFEWDETKNRENVIKHDVSFNRAIEVFDDPVALTQLDRFHDGEEERWNTLGASARARSSLWSMRCGVRRRFGSSPLAPLHRGKGRHMKKHTEGREISAFAAKSDAEIDLSEMPEVLDWSGAEIGKFFRPAKKPVTLRLDGDVIEWLKSFGPGYQTRANGLLRHAMESSSGGNRRKQRKSA